MSPVGLDFMRRLLVKDPNARMTVKQALAHPFIRGSMVLPAPTDVSLMHQYLRNTLADRRMEILTRWIYFYILVLCYSGSFRAFASLDSLTRLVTQLITYTLSLEQVNVFRTEFRIIDQDNSGTVSIHELLAIAGADEVEDVNAICFCNIGRQWSWSIFFTLSSTHARRTFLIQGREKLPTTSMWPPQHATAAIWSLIASCWRLSNSIAIGRAC